MIKQKEIYAEIGRERPDGCVLCLAGVPGGTFQPTGGFHHIVPRSRLPGEENEKLLWAKVNIAHACMPHHELFGHEPSIWQHAMVKMGYAFSEDYVPYKTFRSYLDPRIAECYGLFGDGDAFYRMYGADGKVPESIQKAYCGFVSIQITSFCAHCCPRASECIEETRKKLKES